MDMVEKALVVDDGFLMRGHAVESLREEGVYVEEACSREEACKQLASRSYDFVFSDLEILESIKHEIRQPQGTLLVVMTSFASVDRAIGWVKKGAYDYIVKPFSPEQIALVLSRARELMRLKGQIDTFREETRHVCPQKPGPHPKAVYAEPEFNPPGGVTTNLHELERQTIIRVLHETGGCRNVMAEKLGISVRTLRNKLNQYRQDAALQIS